MLGRLFKRRKKPPPNPNRVWAENDADRWVLSLWAPYLERGSDNLDSEPHWFAKVNGGIPGSRAETCRHTLDDAWGITDLGSTIKEVRALLDTGHRAEYDHYRSFLDNDGLLGKPPEVLTEVARFQIENNLEVSVDDREAAVDHLASIYLFISEREPTLGAAGIGAWDYLRVNHVLGLALCAGYVVPSDCWNLLYASARQAQEAFDSWRHLVSSFNAGRDWWAYADAESSTEFENTCERLLTHAKSPWVTLDWNTVLDPAAHPSLEEQTRSGDTEAQYRLARRYRYGEDVDRNPGLAQQWFQKAAEGGDERAQYDLADMLEHGDGSDKNLVSAARWYRAAAEQGHIYAQTNLASLYEDGEGVDQDYSMAAFWHRAAAMKGRAVSQFMLGFSLEVGRGVAKDLAEAARWYRAAAEQDQRDAQERLGMLLAEGQGVEHDPQAVAHWYRKAAEAGSPSAQTRLALLFHAGEATRSDPVQALAWMTVAHEKGFEPATERLGTVSRNLSDIQIRKAREMADAISARIVEHFGE